MYIVRFRAKKTNIAKHTVYGNVKLGSAFLQGFVVLENNKVNQAVLLSSFDPFYF